MMTDKAPELGGVENEIKQEENETEMKLQDEENEGHAVEQQKMETSEEEPPASESKDTVQGADPEKGLKGDRPKVERVWCEVCNIWTSGPVNYQDHLRGKAHARNLILREQGVKIVGKVGVKDRRARIVKTLQEVKEPLIGLQFIVEFQDDDPRVAPKYVCNLCEDILERRYVISHCYGKSHRYKYLQQAYPEKCHVVSDAKTKAEKKAAADAVAKEVMELEGGPQLEHIKVSLNIDPFGPERKAVMRQFGVGESMGSIMEQIMENGVTFSDILPLMDCCEIRNPEEAAVALQVSNILSQKILSFNTRHLNRGGGYNDGGFRYGGNRGRGWFGRGRGRAPGRGRMGPY